MEITRKKDLGFGCMRMPLIGPKDTTSFDFGRIAQLFDIFLEKGFKYFDVAYTYHGYHAEEVVRRALIKREILVSPKTVNSIRTLRRIIKNAEPL